MGEGIPRQLKKIPEAVSEADTSVRPDALPPALTRLSTKEIQHKLAEIDPEEETILRGVKLSEGGTPEEVTYERRFENAKKIAEELGESISFEEVIQHVPKDFDTSVFGEETKAYLKNAYPNTQYWDPRLITALGECGVHMDLDRTIKPEILVNLKINNEKRSIALNIEKAVALLKAYARSGESEI